MFGVYRVLAGSDPVLRRRCQTSSPLLWLCFRVKIRGEDRVSLAFILMSINIDSAYGVELCILRGSNSCKAGLF